MIISQDIRREFPDLQVLESKVEGVTVKRMDSELEEFKEEIFNEIRETYDLEGLKDRPILRAYRNFFWRLDVDPTKTRPAAEALIRRLLHDKPLPRINTLVDAYNLASVKTEIAICAFDSDMLAGELIMRYASPGEEFLGIGMKRPIRLRGGEIVLSDEERLLAIYPYRDAEDAKITESTKNVLFIFCGVPGISLQNLMRARDLTLNFVIRFCGGVVKEE